MRAKVLIIFELTKAFAQYFPFCAARKFPLMQAVSEK